MHDTALAPAVRRALPLLIIAVVLGGTWPYFERLLDANERPRLLSGIGLIEAGTFAVDGPWGEGLKIGPDVARSVDGQLVPNKPPGATLVAALAWLLTKAWAAVTGGAPTLRAATILARLLGGLVPTLVLASALWRHERAWAAHRAHGPGITAAAARARVDFATLAWLLATPAWSYAKLNFGHALAACLLGVGLLTLAGRPDARIDRRRAALAGLSCGSAVAVEYTAVFAGPAIAVWLLWRERSRPGVIAAAIGGAAIPIAALAGYHAAVFGSPWLTGYHAVVHDQFAAIHGRGLLGLQLPSASSCFEHLISPWGGLLVWAPLCLFGLFGGLHAARTTHEQGERARQLLFASVGACLLLVLIGLEQGGGWRVGPRYFVIAMPLSVAGLVAAVRELGRPGRGLGLALLLGLFVVALAVNFLAANYFPHLIPHGNPVRDLLLPLALAGRTPHGLSPAVVLVLALALVSVVLVRLHRSAAVERWPWIVGGLLGVGLFTA
ncbi:MAG TPA: hypothetical protein VK034_21710, partial [Enhygromyxa sp.]|nr:hypothetical protein [Enhygromyxa sp.]